jgi:hypothetical protein
MRTPIRILLSLFLGFAFIPTTHAQGIKATFTPPARNFPGFGNVTVGKSKDQTIIIKNADTSTERSIVL